MEWYGRSVNPSDLESLEALQALIADRVERSGWPAPISAAAAVPGARVRLAEGSGGVPLGFMVVGRRTRYYPDGDDALLFSRPIFPGRSVPPQ